MARLCTSRVAEINKNTELWFANRKSNTPTETNYGEEIYEYEEASRLEVSLMPFETEVEAKDYGVSFIGGRKAVLTIQQGKLFNEFTHIWVNRKPDVERQNSEYIVKDLQTTLNVSVLIIDKKDGNNGY